METLALMVIIASSLIIVSSLIIIYLIHKADMTVPINAEEPDIQLIHSINPHKGTDLPKT